MTALKWPIHPKNMALINVDMQVAFVEGTPLSAPDGLKLVPVVNKLVAACRQAGVMVVHTRNVTRPDGSNLWTMGELVEPVRNGYIIDGKQTAELHPALDVRPKDIILEKPRYGSFTGTDLDLVLRSNGIDTVIICGICTNICCETTAREAGMRDYHVFFMEDGTETFPIGNLSVEEIKQAVHATIGLAFADVVPVNEMIGHLEMVGNAVAAE